ncbi:Pycsar system effector family protein [Streptomyces sp. SID10815]|uniref:Pycsar system effector family protein n=1 Tax=Streptomyces sp. SID10815 TaxID=2706027 RepID=UPI0013C7E8F2|nr:Pycsar system effector family protein [Streptomyces sp. SID10815]NEA46856.1 integral membrane plasmid transfer protein [Streptomyces sp. SID10815]
MTFSTESSVTDKNLDAACAAVTTEIGRTDNKASLLLAFDGAVLAGLASLADKNLPLPAQLVGGAAGLALAAAAVLLLLVVRPNLGGRAPAPGSFPNWAQLDAATIRASMDDDTRPARIKALSTIAVAKYERLARAVDTILASLALLLVAAVLAVAG